MKNLSLIAAIGKNRELGYQNDLIWKIKEDLKFFKYKTMGSYIIMGKRTYDSLPKNLPGRKYIVLTSDVAISTNEKLKAFRSLDDTLEFVNSAGEENFYVIGGGQVYSSFLPYVDSMYLTEINDSFQLADTFFPAFEQSEWTQEQSNLFEENGIEYKRMLYLRKQR